MITQAQAIERMASTLYNLHMEVMKVRFPKAPHKTWDEIELEPMKDIWRALAEQELPRVIALSHLPEEMPDDYTPPLVEFCPVCGR